MGKITLFIGGARSGKSRRAQQAALSYDDVAYIATAVSTDGEMDERIRTHRAARPGGWHTYECPRDPARAIERSNHAAYLLDCVTVFVANLILEAKAEWTDAELLTREEQQAIETHVAEHIDGLIEVMRRKEAAFLVVTNEVGMGVVPPGPLGRVFRDVAGFANQKIAAAADEVFFAVSGIPVRIKG